MDGARTWYDDFLLTTAVGSALDSLLPDWQPDRLRETAQQGRPVIRGGKEDRGVAPALPHELYSINEDPANAPGQRQSRPAGRLTRKTSPILVGL